MMLYVYIFLFVLEHRKRFVLVMQTVHFLVCTINRCVCVCVCVRSGRLVFGLFNTRMLYPSMQYSGILQ